MGYVFIFPRVNVSPGKYPLIVPQKMYYNLFISINIININKTHLIWKIKGKKKERKIFGAAQTIEPLAYCVLFFVSFSKEY